jgi:hypothetical protein
LHAYDRTEILDFLSIQVMDLNKREDGTIKAVLFVAAENA